MQESNNDITEHRIARTIKQAK